jgi:hypothetical protein
MTCIAAPYATAAAAVKVKNKALLGSTMVCQWAA